MGQEAMTSKIGFIGFGEVGSTFAREMKAKGAEIACYDIVHKRNESRVTVLSVKDLIDTCDILLSTVTTDVARKVAEEAAVFLGPGKTYADMNSTSASVKREIASIVEKSGADFVEGAILSAVGETGPRASILVSGEKAEAFSRTMNQLGLVNLKYFSPRIGEASLVKMIRSVFSKGVECLLLEMLVAGRRAGVADYLWRDIVDFMTKNPFEKVAENWIRTHPLACERRYHEMVQVVETLKEIDVEPLMTRGTRDFFERSGRLNLGRHFEGKPENFWEVPHVLETLTNHRRHLSDGIEE
jgi:3-hydroxyisobutyrate dehydrogenase-like beta-hydroxyacid dehydrogenase